VKDSCSNCVFVKCRRFEAFCTKDLELKSMYHVCDRHERGDQWVMVNPDGSIWWPKELANAR
jgi:hypothetical protein